MIKKNPDEKEIEYGNRRAGRRSTRVGRRRRENGGAEECGWVDKCPDVTRLAK